MIFSVVIPCYNCVKTLEATVNSIRACGLTDYEILLVDDGASDGTAKLCDTLCVRYPELRCVHQKNAGVSAARNRGIDEAPSPFFNAVQTRPRSVPQSSSEMITSCETSTRRRVR